MPTVFFDTNLGGDGSTYNDASFANGGHRINFLPSLNNVLGVANFTLGRANAAATSATNSANSATAANDAKLAAELALDQFTDQYLGPKSSAPTLDNDGNALLTGAIYFDTTKQALQVYTGTIWIDAAGAQASFKKFVFTATANQTVFSVSPDQYTPNFIQAYLDGVLLDDEDYTATDGTTLTLAQGANAGQKLTILRLDSLDIANVVRAIQATDLTPTDSLVFDNAGNATFNFNLSINGNTVIGNAPTDLTTVNGNVNFNQGIDILTGNVNIGLNRTQGTANLTVHQPSTTASVLRLSNTTSGFSATDGFEIFTDGSNAGVWNRENGNITFRTNNLERFSISNLGDSTFNGNLSYTGTLTGGTGVINIGSGQLVKTAGGNLLIGTSTDSGSRATFNTNGGVDNFIRLTNGNAPSGLLIGNFGSGAAGIVQAQAASLGLYTNNLERLTIDSAGNAGLGVAPSAWNSSYKAFEILGGVASYFSAKGAQLIGISSNYFNDSGNADRYVQNGFASRYYQVLGQHIWQTAPSGTAGNPITFTQAMTLTNGGNLLVGTTVDGGKKLMLGGSADVGFINNANTSTTLFEVGLLGGANDATGFVYNRANSPVVFGTNNTERARFTSNGLFLIGSTVNNFGFIQEISGTSQTSLLGLSIFNTTPGSGARIGFLDGSSNRGIGNQANNFIFYSSAQGTDEHARITGSGYFKASNTGSYRYVNEPLHEFNSNQNTTVLAVYSGNIGASTAGFTTELVTGATGRHIYCVLGSDVVYQVLANGNVQNTNNSYGALSDAKLKNLIGPAPSYWEKYKLIEWVKYTLKNDPTNQEQLGVIAQQVRDIFPGLIQETPDMVEVKKTREVTKQVQVTETQTQTTERTEVVLENGEYIQYTYTDTVEVQVPVFDEFDLKDEFGEVIGVHKVPRMQTVTETEEYTEMEPNGEVTLSVKYSILGHISDVVLQEAMARIEVLEAKLA